MDKKKSLFLFNFFVCEEKFKQIWIFSFSAFVKSPIASATDVASSPGQLYYNATITISHCDNKDNNNNNKKKHSFHTMRILPQFIWLIT